MEPCRACTLWSQMRITLMRSRIRFWISFKVKSSNRIRITVKRGIRIRIKMIRNPDIVYFTNFGITPWKDFKENKAQDIIKHCKAGQLGDRENINQPTPPTHIP
jgi:hypothetical protein